MNRIVVLFLILTGWPLLLTAQRTPSYILHLRNATIAPEKNIDAVGWPAFFQAQPTVYGGVNCLLQFDSMPVSAQLKELSSLGVVLGEFVSGLSYRARLATDPGREKLKAQGVRAAFTLGAAEKLSPELFAKEYPAWAVRSAGTVNVWLQYGSYFNLDQIQSLLSASGFLVVNTRFHRQQVVEVSVSADRLMALASLSYVDYVQSIPAPDQEINYRSRTGARANLANAPLGVGGRALLGEGLVIGVGDNGDALTHIDFNERVISRYGFGTGQHGVHVSGTVGGGGIISDTLAGYAPRAKIISQYFNYIFDFSPQYVRDEGMVLSNNSYGAVVNQCDYNGLYDLYSRLWDQQAFDLPQLLHVFAAGNSGTLTCVPYATGFKTVLGSYQSAKNVLTVGATQFNGQIAGFSSRGPVIDGRIKPEITTQGAAVVSTGFGGYYTNNGTSMACPAATGGAALLIQRFRQLNGGSNPANALVKNLLCNGATDKGNEGPDYTYGFGWMNLDRSLSILENTRYASDSVIAGGVISRTVSVPVGQSVLKVMLNWNDPAAPMVAYRTLVNNLDLELVTPSGTVLLPRILDTLAARVNEVAGTGVDRINNIEQITLYNPPAGNYTVRVRGTSVTTSRQTYFISWDLIPTTPKLTFPVGGESFRPGQSINIQWDATATSGGYDLEYSIDNGASWTSIVTGLVATTDQFLWITPSITSDQVRVRLISRANNAMQASQSFLLIGLSVASLSAVQCETYVSMDWTAVPGATDYEVMRLIGSEMQSIAIVPAGTTRYVFSGLSRDSVYWVGVRPRLNGKPGRRSTSISHQPNSGTCAGSISNNDLRMEALISPASSGRLNTSQFLPANQVISVRIKNLDDVAYTGPATLTYQINGGSIVTENTTLNNLAPGASIGFDFATPANLSAAGTYTLQVTVLRPNDPVAANNVMTQTVRQLNNQPLNLTTPWLDGFDALPKQELVQAQMGLNGSDRYDFSFLNAQGRLRTFINSGMSFSGERTLTMDVRLPVGGGNTNYLTGTYNLSNYTLSNDVRLDFRYKHHGQVSNANNRVWIRGNDAAPWIQAYDLFANQAELGTYQSVTAIELSDLLAANGQTFSSSFQIRWGQWGQYSAADEWSGAGYSLDDIRLYMVGDDIQLLRIEEPLVQICAPGQGLAVKVMVQNSGTQLRTNVPIRLQVNNGSVVSEAIPSLAPNATVSYIFTQLLNLTGTVNPVLKVWVDLSGDSYRANDSLQTTIRVLPVVSAYPYVQDFESGSDWYPAGNLSTWELGIPESYRIMGTGSGVKSWKTRLKGQYNDNEWSYLYSPCFNLSGLTSPMLSFLVALDLEDCGNGFCDGAYVEYSADGQTWMRLGGVGQGVNWYNKNYPGNPLWSTQTYARWHVATIPLPTGIPSLRLRFVLRGDASVSRDGIAVDDIHIYENGLPIYSGPTLTTPVNLTYTSTGAWQPAIANNQLVASVQTIGQSGTAGVQAFLHSGSDRFTNGQYYLDRNWVMNGSTALTDTARLRLYFLDREADSLVFATGCSACERVGSVGELGVTRYRDGTGTTQNLLLSDNGPGQWSYLTRQQVRRVPYQNGYYMELPVREWSEFWANSGWRDRIRGLPVDILSFRLERLGTFSARLSWSTAHEYEVVSHEVQVAKGNAAWQQQQYVTLATLSSAGNAGVLRSYQNEDNSSGKSDVWYYRVKITHRDGWYVYTTAQPIVFDATSVLRFYPNPSSGMFKGVFQANAGESLRVTVFDATGRSIRSQQVMGTGFQQSFWLDLSSPSIATGIYLVQVELRGQVTTQRVIKQ
ncbi:MAG: T9SS type A sorting domain-containing protein [Bacteroidetes bacterium]|nr:T9SS type A sorting domain-containing protein [Bacteroidota bacterium]